jgi:NADPH-dependent glutamate synthase beta subunit-like oxidoreductase/NAD(P)H-flavin reductase
MDTPVDIISPLSSRRNIVSTAANLKFDFSFEDFYRRDGLIRLDQVFLRELAQVDAGLHGKLLAARQAAEPLAAKTESELLLALAPHLDDFIGQLFGIGAEVSALSARHHSLAPLYSVKRLFVQRKAMHKYKPDAAAGIDGPAVGKQLEELFGGPLTELAFASHVSQWQQDEAGHADALELALQYAAWATHTESGHARHHDGVLFKAPHKLDYQNLVHTQPCASRGYTEHRFDVSRLRQRSGFKLTDQGTDLTGALDEANYCIWCHEQGKDSCSKGLKEKGASGRGAQSFKKSPFGITLAGCPLEEKISEFHKAKTEGLAIGALAIITVDNPMAAATGHRICNDCMKSCIYQKQEPVNIPQAETRTLKDVLELPWGFEIYSLLTRWNPLNLRNPYPKAPTGKRVLVAGMGPAGFSLSHFLMNDGHTVVGIDGLKIEPLPPALSGVDAAGKRVPFQPIRDIRELHESLDQRAMAGFGGVAEYGITVRWDKNFLKIIRLLLERRDQFSLFGGVRFGGTVTAEDAFALGFDHIALAIGAGRPTVLDMPNGLARGVRTASDFLMALQLTGAAKDDSIANMQLRLPVVVIGGGLTAIDTATESLAYYPLQVEKFLKRHETLVSELGEAGARINWSPEERSIAEEFIAHAKAIRAERAAAAKEDRELRIVQLLQSWGGATIAYRKRMVDSPSYTLNHEEIDKALEEGITFAECLTPLAIETDEYGHARGLKVAVQTKGEDGERRDAGQTVMPARAVLIAAGTQPNTVLAREDSEHFVLDGRYFQACDASGQPVVAEKSISKPNAINVLLSKCEDGRCISFFGDVHPSFFGNVVKAVGSAKQGYPVVSKVLEAIQPAAKADDADFLSALQNELRATVHEVKRLTPTIVEVIIKAPLAARRFHPGQFYRLQNFEARAQKAQGSTLAMEGLALTGAWVDRERGLLSTIVLEMGGSSSLCMELKAGEPVILMGPTGAPTEIASGETVVLVGGGLGNAVLFSIGQAMRKAGSKVLYFAGYKSMADRYHVGNIEAASDVVIWCCDEQPGFKPSRPSDQTFVGNIVQAMNSYASGALGEQVIPFKDADRIIAIGSDKMMAAVAKARHEILKPHLKECHHAVGSINSPMQCMMKEICAQCLQPHVDPETGKKSVVFSCFNQDQELDHVDWPALDQRLKQNSTQEKLTAAWLKHCLAR